jgi:hypothetical protein
MPGRTGFLYRRCPDCGVVLPESGFGWVTDTTPGPGQRQRRECPSCGFSGPPAAFQIVERSAEQGQAP